VGDQTGGERQTDYDRVAFEKLENGSLEHQFNPLAAPVFGRACVQFFFGLDTGARDVHKNPSGTLGCDPPMAHVK
jgi:hypothetical protein